MGQSSRDRSSSKDDKADEKEDGPEVVFEPARALVEAVQDDAPPAEAPADVPPAETPELNRDEDIAAAQDRISAELIRLKSSYGDTVARTVGEHAITMMRRA